MNTTRTFGVDTRTLDLLAGHIAKVRHSRAVRLYPLTCQLLRTAECENATYAEYVRYRGSVKFKSGPQDSDRAIEFLRHVSDPCSELPRPSSGAIKDVATHESIICSLSQLATSEPPWGGRLCQIGVDEAFYPVIVFGSMMAFYEWDVLRISQEQIINPPFPRFQDPKCLFYSPVGDGTRIAALDSASALILQKCDGNNSCRELATNYGLKLEDIFAFVQACQGRGLIEQKGLVQ